MAANFSKIVPCLWFDSQAEDAAKYYVSFFENSSIEGISHYSAEGREVHGRAPGSVMTVAFRLAGQTFTALNGGPQFKFTEAISLQVFCDSQVELDHYWKKLTDGGEEGVCGWLKDRFGLSWQVVPSALPTLLGDRDPGRTGRVMNALLQMRKFDISALQRAYDGA